VGRPNRGSTPFADGHLHDELGDAVGLPAIATGTPLGFIRDHICIPRKLPFLNFIAVQSGSRRPGESFLCEGLKTEMDDELFWRGMVLQVFAFNWNDVPFDA